MHDRGRGIVKAGTAGLCQRAAMAPAGRAAASRPSAPARTAAPAAAPTRQRDGRWPPLSARLLLVQRVSWLSAGGFRVRLRLIFANIRIIALEFENYNRFLNFFVKK